MSLGQYKRSAAMMFNFEVAQVSLECLSFLLPASEQLGLQSDTTACPARLIWFFII